jgi:hypothetical protein
MDPRGYGAASAAEEQTNKANPKNFDIGES